MVSGNGQQRGEIAGEVAGAVIGAKGTNALAKGLSGVTIANPVPNTLAPVVPTEFVSANLGRASSAEVIVTAANDIQGLNSTQIANKLTIPQSPSGFTVYEFPTPSTGLATPFASESPGFIGGGRTAGGVREFLQMQQLKRLGHENKKDRNRN